jgi:glucose-1-phosphate thymidylyltransferase
LLLIKGRPIVDYIIDRLKLVKEIDEIFLVTNSKFIGRFRSWKAAHRLKAKITLVDDLTKDNDTRLGAIGDLNFAIADQNIKDGLVVIGGDNLFTAGLQEFVSFSRKHDPCCVIGAFGLKDKKDAVNYGVLELDESGLIKDFTEKPRSPKTALVAMCLYYFPAEKLRLVKEYIAQKNIKKDTMGLYIDWLSRRDKVYAFVFGGSWHDIGDHEFYNAAKGSF